jgi:flagellar motor protein MotB
LNLKETNAELARKAFEEREKVVLAELKENIEKLIESNPALKQFKSQLLIDITSEGLRIQIVDEQNRPMFDTSSAELKPYTRVILREIGEGIECRAQQAESVGSHRRGSIRWWRQRLLELGAFCQSGECFAPRIDRRRHG